jgi:hypothetical protein
MKKIPVFLVDDRSTVRTGIRSSMQADKNVASEAIDGRDVAPAVFRSGADRRHRSVDAGRQRRAGGQKI